MTNKRITFNKFDYIGVERNNDFYFILEGRLYRSSEEIENETIDDFVRKYKDALCQLQHKIEELKNLDNFELMKYLVGDIPALDSYVLDHYKPSRTILQLQRWTGLSVTSIKKVLNRHKLEAAKPNATNGLKSAVIEKNRKEGKTDFEIDDILDFPRGSVSDVMDKREIYKNHKRFIKSGGHNE